jgi:ElaB/YqjD/DUF883 family membrane-anchored ribosome-binding protein
MANEDLIHRAAGESSTQDVSAHIANEGWRTVEDLKSAAPALAKDYVELATEASDQTQARLHTLRKEAEDYVRENPMKTVLTALGVGFMLARVLRR